ncbi:MAG: hypothetical protein QXD70_04885 [Candidatus Bathyarchaeia archaeon]
MQITEYLFAALMIMALILGATFMMITITSPTTSVSQKEQLKIATEKIATQILLDPGYPYNWGSTTETPKVFGLAKQGQTSRQAYELDPDKVLRLNQTVAGNLYLQPEDTVKILNIQNEYGFTLEFKTPIQINMPQQINPPADTYEIQVITDQSLPLIGAKVSATLYYINNSQNPPRISHSAKVEATTEYDGSCTLNFGTTINTAKILAVIVDYYGIHATKLYPITQCITATLFQKGIANPSQPYHIENNADCRQVILTHNEGYELNDFTTRNIGEPNKFALSELPEYSTVALIAISNGNTLLLATRDFAQITYQTIPFQDQNTKSADFAYSLERTVFISGSTYIATLYVWRMTI